MINEKNLFNQSWKIDLRTYANIRMIGYSQGDDYITRCLLDYPDLKKHKMIAIDFNRK